ncbi:MAG: PAS domain-containing sensor histidine kinase [bacterium]
METHFLIPEKETYEKVLEQHSKIENEIDKTFFFDAVPFLYLILNSKRQIVWANKSVIDSFGYSDIFQVLGLRPGELFQCVHAFETEGGCGTTEFCTTCGAANAINAGLNGKFEYKECRIEKTHSSDALDLKVSSIPFQLNGGKYVIFTIVDISHEKRRKVLERIFFHDIVNTAGNLSGYLSLLDPSNPDEYNSDKQTLISLSQDLLDEINSQKILLNAENNELSVSKTQINSKMLLDELIQKYKRHHISEEKILLISEDSANVDFQCDATLLKRAFGNMIKNAIEASNPGDKITVGSRFIEGNIKFWVHNETSIPRDIQLQLFQRSFSTKGNGRGLGTYSMKLLTERYLGGKVTFSSSEEEGTVFKISIPVEK